MGRLERKLFTKAIRSGLVRLYGLIPKVRGRNRPSGPHGGK